jgi:hypothetical protein
MLRPLAKLGVTPLWAGSTGIRCEAAAREHGDLGLLRTGDRGARPFGFLGHVILLWFNTA